MVTNLNKWSDTKEVALTTYVQNEVVQIFGIPCKYLKKTLKNLDRVLGEDALMEFTDYADINLLPDSPDFFNSDQSLFGKFGYNEIDLMTMYIEQTNFRTLTGKNQPEEGDIVFIEIYNSFYKVSFAKDRGLSSDKNTFYVNGTLSCFRIDLSKLQFSHETINTTSTAIQTHLPSTSNQATTDNDTSIDENKKKVIIDDFDELLK